MIMDDQLLSRAGALRAQARHGGCALVQLSTDERRTDAHRFHARLGFDASHEGFTLPL